MSNDDELRRLYEQIAYLQTLLFTVMLLCITLGIALIVFGVLYLIS